MARNALVDKPIVEPIQKHEHGGNIHKLNMQKNGGLPLLDFSANINPLGPPAWLRSLINRDLHLVGHYPVALKLYNEAREAGKNPDCGARPALPDAES